MKYVLTHERRLKVYRIIVFKKKTQDLIVLNCMLRETGYIDLLFQKYYLSLYLKEDSTKHLPTMF